MDLSEEWRKLRPALGNIICHIDSKMQSIEAEEKRIQEKRDDSYIRGVYDMVQAVIAFTGPVEKGCMSKEDMLNYVGCTSISDALNIMSIEEFIEKCNKWKADKETKEKMDKDELHIGDEVTVLGSDVFTYIILYRIYENEDLFKLIEPTTLLTRTYSAKSLIKTGKHYDYIRLPKEETKNEFSI